jgi:hypothetical protein
MKYDRQQLYPPRATLDDMDSFDAMISYSPLMRGQPLIIVRFSI